MKFFKIPTLYFLCCSVLFLAHTAVAHSRENIAILVPAHIRPYMEMVDGIKESPLKGYSIFYLDKDIFYVKKQISMKHWDVFLAIGYKSVTFLDKLNVNGTSYLYSMIVYPEDIPKNSNFKCGVYLAVPPEYLLSNIANKLKCLNTLLIPVSSRESLNYALSIKNMAKNFNMNILIIELKQNNILKTISKLWDKFDGVLFVPDPIFSSSEVSSFIIEKAILHKKAVIGYNRFFLDNGALIAFLVDFKKTGFVTGKLIKDFLDKKICISSPAVYNIKINDAVLKYIKTEDIK